MPRAKQAVKSSSTVGNIHEDLQSLRDDVTQLSQQLETLLRDAGSDVLDDVMSRLGRARSTVDEMIADAGEKGRDAARAARELTDDLVGDVEETVRKHPVITVAIALGVGFILSSAMRK